MKYDLITILGPTAAGKTRLGVQLANRFDGEIISADSRQVYRRMDIGSGKDLSEYVIDGRAIKHHLIDVIEPTDEFNLYDFFTRFKIAYEEIKGKNKIPFLVGGTGLYLHSILKGYSLNDVKFSEERKRELAETSHTELIDQLKKLNPNLHNTTDLTDKERTINAILIAEQQAQGVRINLSSLNIGVHDERGVIKQRITKRLKERLKNGMIEEVEGLMKEGVTIEKLNFFGLEYKYIGQYLTGELSYNDAFQKLNSRIHNFAKKQMTWYRKMEKEGIEINWVKPGEFEKAGKIIEEKFFGEK